MARPGGRAGNGTHADQTEPKQTMSKSSGMRLAVAGKGGTGKSVIAGTISRLLARRGESVLAINGDFMPGLPCSLGVDPSWEPP